MTRADTLLVNYSYLADGSKAEAERADGSGLVYRGSLTYRKDSSGTLALEGVPFTAGRLTPGGVRYHVTDHLGSVRAVVDGNTGDILEAGDYGVYGARSAAATGTWPTGSLPTGETLRHRFTGKEDQGPDFGLALTDFGARLYSPPLRRWLTPDPLGEKYYDISPYTYCAGDPVNLVDEDGEKIVVKGSVPFKNKVYAAINYLTEKEVSKSIDYIAMLEESYIIVEGGSSKFDANSRSIVWNPNNMSFNREKTIMRSPTVSLAHEFAHAEHFARDSFQYLKDAQTKDSAYDSIAEKNVITGEEQMVARALGEISDDQVTRDSHYGRTGPSVSDLSTKEQSRMAAFYNILLERIDGSLLITHAMIL